MQDNIIYRFINGKVRPIKATNDYMNKIMREKNKRKKYNQLKKELAKNNIIIEDDRIANIDERLIDNNFNEINDLMSKYSYLKAKNPPLKIKGFTDDEYLSGKLNFDNNTNDPPIAGSDGTALYINIDKFNDYDAFMEYEKELQLKGWQMIVNKNNIDKYAITHEFGHIIENYWWNIYSKKEYYDFTNDIAKNVLYELKLKTNLSQDEMIKKYLSNYVNYLYDNNSNNVGDELVAELFTQMELGKQNEATKVLEEILKDFEN